MVMILNAVDKAILKVLLTPDGRHTTKSIADKLGIPLSTVLRHRARLENNLIKSNYTLNLDTLGWRRVDFFISTNRGKTEEIGKTLMNMEHVTYVGKSIGEHTIDLRAEAIVMDNSCILRLLENIKSLDGVNDVVWSEIVSIMGQKMSIPPQIIDKF